MGDISSLTAGLSPDRRALLELLLAEERATESGSLTIPRRKVRDSVPLSFAQQRLWILDQLGAGKSAFNLPLALRMTGELRIPVLERCLNEIVGRHEALRTTIKTVDGQPVQNIAPQLTLALPVADLEGMRGPDRENEVIRLAAEEAQTPFNLAEGPLLRLKLLRLAEFEHAVLLTMHHIVGDAWSAGVLVEEVSSLYKAFAVGAPSQLNPLPIQYADYACWQRDHLKGEVLNRHLSYWKSKLNGVAALDLKTDHPRPPVQSYRGAREAITLSKPLTAALGALAREEDATLFMTLMAAFQTLLHRYTGQEDIVVGTDVANRTRAETERLIGFFVNMLGIRTDFSNDPTFRQVLGRVRENALEAFTHQDLPFEKLVGALQVERDLSRFPIFQAVFVLQNAPLGRLELPGLVLTSIPFKSNSVKFDLILFMIESEGQIFGIMEYSTDLFEASSMSRMLKQFETLLGSIVEDRDTRVSELKMLTEDERKQMEMEEQARRELERGKLVSRKRKALELSELEPVKTGHLSSEGTLPLVIRPAMRNVSLAGWAGKNANFIEDKLLKYGAILFRGFNVKSVAQFQDAAQAICPDLFEKYGDLPREGASDRIYGSTPYPSDQAILFHNESSHLHQWPLKIFFCCLHPAQQGGETPIVDCRRVYLLLDPAIRDQFERRGLTYIRNYVDGLDVSWQEFFRTSDKGTVEELCAKARIEFTWKRNGLRTRKVRAAVATHPRTGEKVFFNQIQLHHVSCLEGSSRRALEALFQAEDYPRSVCFGDGEKIGEEMVEEIANVYRKAEVSFQWETGDILMLDNMLVAHGRNPFAGARKVIVAMGEMVRSDQ